MDRFYLLSEIFTFIFLIVALFSNAKVAEQRHDAWHKFKVVMIAASIVGLIVWAKELARYSILFLIAALFSLDKNSKKNGEKQNSAMDS